MTTTSITTSPSTTTPRISAGIGLACCLLALTGTVIGAHNWGEILVVSAVVVVSSVLVFGLVVPRALRKDSAGGTALGLSIPALLLLLPAFWSGLPLVLGVAGAVVGNAGRRAPGGSGKCTTAVALGALAAIGYLAIYVFDSMTGGAGFLFE